jgi:hypothetical protein
MICSRTVSVFAAIVAFAFVMAWPTAGAAGITTEAGAEQTCRMEVVLPSGNSTALAGVTKLVPYPDKTYAGIYSIGSTITDYTRFRSTTGYRPAILYTFHDWVSDDNWSSPNPTLRTLRDNLEGESISPLDLAEELATRDSILAVSWAIQCCQFNSKLFWLGLENTKVSIPNVLEGQFDDYIRKVARQVKQYAKPIMISPFSEFPFQGIFSFGRSGTELMTNVDDLCSYYGDPTWPDGPERVRDVYRKIIDIFRAEGVLNVTWFMYAATRYMDPTHEDYSRWLHPRFFYPGDAYMDWVGQSAFFYSNGESVSADDGSAPMDQAVRPGYDAWREVTDRPVFLPEFAAYAKHSQDRAAILARAFRVDLPSMPGIRAFTLVDAELFEVFFAVPRFGKFSTDAQMWKQSIENNPRYTNRLRFAPN